MDDLLGFLDHAAGKGHLPAATATALQVATRNILGVLTPEEQTDLSRLDLAAVVRRFHNRRASDFSAGTLKEYGRRFHRAVALYLEWRKDPANFSVQTRATSVSAGRKAKARNSSTSLPDTEAGGVQTEPAEHDGAGSLASGEGYRTAVPIRPGVVVEISNLPSDLTAAEAERLAGFIRLLAVE
jgi:hypothetical protein